MWKDKQEGIQKPSVMMQAGRVPHDIEKWGCVLETWTRGTMVVVVEGDNITSKLEAI